MGARRMLRSAAAIVGALERKVLRLGSRRPSHATVVAYAALFVALGGTALAATQTFILGATNRVNAASAVTNVKADNTQNPIANPLLTLTNLSTGTGATALALKVASGHQPFTTTSATRVTNLNADKLDNLDSTAFVKLTTPASGVRVGEPWHEVGAPGEPHFNSDFDSIPVSLGYQNFDPATYNTAGFYKDPLGIVHIKGLIKLSGLTILQPECDDISIFQLPVGYRPALKEVHETNRQIDIDPQADGWLELCTSTAMSDGSTVVLDGITFRAAD
jgi:hypothetical protein